MISWNANLYDSAHSFVTQYGESVLELLKVEPRMLVADVGCGTGHLTAKIAESGARVIGVDADPDMIAKAHLDYPQMDFQVADAAEFTLGEPADAIFSNAAFHWMLHIDRVFENLARNSKPGAQLVFEMGGKGNVSGFVGSLQDAIAEETGTRPPYNMSFLSIGEASTLLEKVGYRVEQAYLFDRPTKLEGADGYRNWFLQFGEKLLEHVAPDRRDALLARGAELARPTLYRDGSWYADYVRLRVKATLRS